MNREIVKECLRCDEEKPLSEYYCNAARPDGHSDYCKSCDRARQEAQEARHKAERGAILPPLAKHWLSKPLIHRTDN
jgi:hypothetical protein